MRSNDFHFLTSLQSSFKTLSLKTRHNKQRHKRHCCQYQLHIHSRHCEVMTMLVLNFVSSGGTRTKIALFGLS